MPATSSRRTCDCQHHLHRYSIVSGVQIAGSQPAVPAALERCKLTRHTSAEALKRVFVVVEVCAIESPDDDSLTFLSDRVHVEAIREDQEGARRHAHQADGHARNLRIPQQVDVGAGDAVVPLPEIMDYPGLLDLPRARLRAYRPETSITDRSPASRWPISASCTTSCFGLRRRRWRRSRPTRNGSGAAIGGLMVLHKWGQRLQHHPHVHWVVPAGGLSPDGAWWITHALLSFSPVKVLRQVFRGKLVAGLRTAFREGRLSFRGVLQTVAS